MRIIAITAPDFPEREAEAVTALLQAGIWRVHIRKPEASSEEVASLLNAIPEEYRWRLSLHYHLPLALEYHLGGVHLNSRNSLIPEGFTGLVSCSCHSLEEVATQHGRVDYMFLSPIFDSISKQGYKSAFSAEQLQQQAAEGLLDDKVFALGGVCPANTGQLKAMGFQGAAVLGHLWEDFRRNPSIPALIDRFQSL